jgi:hypothetical protein
MAASADLQNGPFLVLVGIPFFFLDGEEDGACPFLSIDGVKSLSLM